MGFVRVEGNEKTKDWEFLQNLGIKNIWGKVIGPDFCDLIIDYERSFYFVPLGSTNLSRDNLKSSYYALCINGNVINLEVDEQRRGRVLDKTVECHWIIKKIEFPPNWSFELVSNEELKKIICEAFVAKTYSKTYTPDTIKSLTVDFIAWGDKSELN